MLLIGISCAWIAGIWLGSQFCIPAALILSAVLPVPLIFGLKNHRKHLILLALVLLFLFSGAWLSPTLSHTYNSIKIYNHLGPLDFNGIIAEAPEKQDNKNQLVISIQEINHHSVYGKVLYTTYSNSNLKYGDVIIGQIVLEEPPTFGNFNYAAYLAGEGIYSIVQVMDYKIIDRGAGSTGMTWLFDLRENLSQSLAASLPEPQASLCQGIVLGIRSNISQELRAELSESGTTHLLAISGLNLTIVAGLLLSLTLLFCGRRYFIYVWLTLCIIWFYAVLTGLQAPVIRSAIMASIFLIAEILGRQKNAFPTLAFSAAIMVAFSPQVLFNLSFQLSFMAMVGLIFITPYFTEIGRKAVYAGLGEESSWAKPLTAITDSFSVSLGAVIAVWPISSYTFGIISLVGPVTTFLISPALTPIIIFGSLTAFVGLFNLAIAQAIGWVAWLFLSYMIVIAVSFAALPSAFIKNNPFDYRFIWLYYVLFLLFINLKTALNKLHALFGTIKFNLSNWSNSVGEIIGSRSKYIIPPLLIITILTSLACTSLPENNLQVSFLDVGEGDAILIQANGQNILIDGGPSGQTVCQELGKLLPFWERKIDLLILSHPHLDHLTGLLEVMKRYQIGKILASPLSSDLPSYQEFLQRAVENKIEYLIAKSGQQFMLSNGALLNILNPSDNIYTESSVEIDDCSLVMLLTYGDHSIFLTSDIGSKTESLLLRERLVKNTDILKIAHHGSATSSSASFLMVTNPAIAVISVGANNQFGHPDQSVLARIHEAGIKTIYRTDLDGTITFVIDDKSSTFRVKTARKI